MTERRRVRLSLSPQAERYVRQDAPVQVRRLAAGGALPPPPVELVTVLFALVHDPDAEVKERARESLQRLPEGVCNAALSGPAQPVVLSYLAHLFEERPERLELIALNPAADDATIAYLAGLPHKRIVDIVAQNQERMLRCPDIVEALGANRLTGRAVIDRILSFLGLSRPAAEVDEEAEETPAPLPPEALSDAQAQAALRAVLGDDASGFVRELVDDAADVDASSRANLHSLIQNMSIFEKIKLARMGNKEARGLLVRDRNKIVAAAAVRSPKVSELEIVSFAKARNISDEVLRLIASNREWTRNYQVRRALAMNPRCPMAWAIKFLNYLQERDLREIMRSKEVPSGISTQARRILSKKGKV